MTQELTTFIVVAGLLVTILALLLQVLKESSANQRAARKKERRAIIKLVKSMKPMTADPDVREFRALVLSEINERDRRD